MSEIVSVNLAAWLACLTFMVVLLVNGLKLSDRLRGKEPQPPNGQINQAVHGLADRVTKLESADENLRRELEQGRRLEDEAAAKRRQAIYDMIRASEARVMAKVDECLANDKQLDHDLGGLQTGQEMMGQSINQMAARLDRLIERKS